MEERTGLPFPDRRQHRKLVRFDPTVSMGTIGQVIALLLVAGGAWSTYSADRATTNFRLALLEKRADDEKAEQRIVINELRVGLSQVNQTVQSVDRNLVVLQTQIENAKRSQQ
jgi:hypothetical protein